MTEPDRCSKQLDANLVAFSWMLSYKSARDEPRDAQSPACDGALRPVAKLVMRSPELAAVNVVPILLVMVWLLGFMYLCDYDFNVITATIAAISVAVGVDFSIHYAMCFREELARAGDRMAAIGLASEGTGTALTLSGGTSVIGFASLPLAPMLILAAYGLLTAVMIPLSLLASLRSCRRSCSS